MNIDLEDLPAAWQFAYIALTQSAIFFKESGHGRDLFISFCDEIWKSMEMTDVQHLKSVLSEKMKKDLEPHVDAYIKRKKTI